ncbi:hypothetical protein [Tenacibaculum aquimarinum]|uniref:hypothetical protein n=1 Tax=Tenacibaculum aquimarinum TaxID=2910675 RepID=UPI001F0AC787|nr:hypothetical protein [Tenacibaculum aquimarinum]MCH3885895.1 hypothetical protein [Tenacibaculum aquimarinum]
MKKKTILLLAIISLTFFNCLDKERVNLTPEQERTMTPEVLEERESDFSISSYSKRYDSDIIFKLYSEALRKNKKLKLLDTRIKEFTNDSVLERTKLFTKYSSVNNNYWNTVNQYISSLNDSIIQKETSSIFNKLKVKYEAKIKNHNNMMNVIENEKDNLRDRLTLMKLFITEPMMSNYQVNEIPNIKELEDLISQYKKLIEETKNFTKNK